jgi:hypothetical protein
VGSPLINIFESGRGWADWEVAERVLLAYVKTLEAGGTEDGGKINEEARLRCHSEKVSYFKIFLDYLMMKLPR